MQGLPQTCAFSRRSESTNSLNGYIPEKDNEKIEIGEGSNKAVVQQGEDVISFVTYDPSFGEKGRCDLRLGQEIDRINVENEFSNWESAGWKNLKISTSENDENNWPESNSKMHMKSNGKDKPTTVEENIGKPLLVTGLAENPTPFDSSVDTSVAWAQRLPPSTEALVLYTNRST